MKSITLICTSLAALSLLGLPPRLGAQNTLSVTTLHSFTGTGTEGAYPEAALIQAKDGNFYGTTAYGGSNGTGTVFQITLAGAVTTLHSFGAIDDKNVNADGARPYAGLVQGSDGNFYGTAPYGGSAGMGTIFRVTPAGVFTKLYTFTDGGFPRTGLIQGSDGNFYGTAELGVFKITPTGALTALEPSSESSTPLTAFAAGLIQADDGNFYSTTSYGGSNSFGTVFRITPEGKITILHSFTYHGADDGVPSAALVQGGDSNFYGTASQGDHSRGAVFRMTPAGKLATLHGFSPVGSNNDNEDGAEPLAALVQGDDGNFYGTALRGGSAGTGTIFQISPTGAFTTLHSFTHTGADGSFPYAGLIQGSDGNFYGTAQGGGASGKGIVYKMGYFPGVTNAPGATARVGKGFSYQIAATNSPVSYSVLGLPKGLTVNARTGVISGTPTAVGTVKLTLRATNKFGTGTALVILTTYEAAAPEITSADTAHAQQGKAFTYQIKATNGPTSYGVLDLPKGLTIDGNTGLISGEPDFHGTRTMTLEAFNAYGSATKPLTLMVQGLPVITSAKAIAGKVGEAFSYQITATEEPTRFKVFGLTPGLCLDAKTGLISGTPSVAAVRTLTLEADNADGIGQGKLTLTISK